MSLISPQVQIYRTLVAVFRKVVDDIETNFRPHSKAQYWQQNLEERILEFLDTDQQREEARGPAPDTEGARQRENGERI